MITRLKRWHLFYLLIIGLLSAACYSLYRQADFEQRLVAVSWGDGIYGKAFYGAYVYLGDARDGQVEVKAKIQIGRGTYLTNYAYDVGVIGMAANDADAVKRWGKITWTAQGVEFGGDNGRAYLLPRQVLEAHR